MLLLSTVITSLLTLKLGAIYLSEEEIGLWIILRQTIGYLILLDFGISASVGRIYSKEIHQAHSKSLNTISSNIALIIIIQTIVICLLGYYIIRNIGGWFELNELLNFNASIILSCLIVTAVLRQFLRMKEGLLHANNQYYVIGFSSVISVWIELFTQFGCFMWGLGIYSLPSGQIAGSLIFFLIILYQSSKKKYTIKFSVKDISLTRIREIIRVSFGFFFVGLFAQILFLSQPVITGYLNGLASSTKYSVNMRGGFLLRSLMAKAVESWVPKWQALFDKGNTSTVRFEYINVCSLILNLTLVSAGFLIIANSTIVSLIYQESSYIGEVFDVLTAIFIAIHFFTGAMTIPFILAVKMSKRALVSLLQLIVSLLLSVYLGAKFREEGVVIGIVLGITSTGFIYNAIVSPKLIDMKVKIFWRIIIKNSFPYLFLLAAVGYTHILYTDKHIIKMIAAVTGLTILLYAHKDFIKKYVLKKNG